MPRVSIAWMGFHEEGVGTLQALLSAGRAPLCAVTLDEDAGAQRSARADVAGICRDAGIPVLETASGNSPEVLAFLRSFAPDVLIVLGWSQILSGEVLRVPAVGTLGAHASVLPHNRGSAPVNWAIIRGEVSSGNSLMWLNEGVDTGELVDQRTFPIELWDSCATVYQKVARSNAEMILELLPLLDAGNRPGVVQPHSDQPLLPRRRPRDGRIEWSSSAHEVYNLIRGVTRPYPGAFTKRADQTLRVWNAAVLPLSNVVGTPGEVLGPCYSPDLRACGLTVACGVGAVLLTECALDDVVLNGPALAELCVPGEVLA